MASSHEATSPSDTVPVIDLSAAPGSGEAWDRPRWQVYLWGAVELTLLTNPWQISSSLRAKVLRTFGATIGEGVIIRPRTRVKYPWKLTIGDRSWIGEGVWIHNQDEVVVGEDAVISQETFITTGSHDHRIDMALITKPVTIEDGAWITSRCVVTGGVTVGRSALVQPLTRVSKNVPPNVIFGSEPPKNRGLRFPTESPARDD